MADTYCGLERTETQPSSHRNCTNARMRSAGDGMGGVPVPAQNAQNLQNFAATEVRPEVAFDEARASKIELRSAADKPTERGT